MLNIICFINFQDNFIEKNFEVKIKSIDHILEGICLTERNFNRNVSGRKSKSTSTTMALKNETNELISALNKTVSISS